MRLISLRLTNFRQHADTAVAFAPGLTGIVGANGEGKSTLLEAISFALFGTRAIRGSKGSVRWNRAPVRRTAEVILSFEVGGTAYTLTRGEASADLREQASGRCIAEGTSAVDAEIPRLVGMSYAEFAATYLCSQKDLSALLSMKPTERERFFLRVTGVGRVDQAIRLCRARRSELRAEVGGLRVGLGDRGSLEAEVAAAEAAQNVAIVELDDAHDAAEASDANLASATRDDRLSADRATRDADLARRIASAESSSASVRDELARATERRQAAEAAGLRAAEAAPRLDALSDLLERRELQREAGRRRSERTALWSRALQAEHEKVLADESLSECERVIRAHDDAAFADAAARETALQHELSILSEARAEDRAEAKSERIAAETEAERHRRRADAIRAAGCEGQCPTCLRELGGTYENVVAGLDAEMARELDRAAAAAVRYDALQRATDDELKVAAKLAEVRVQLLALRATRDAANSARAHAQRWSADVERLGREIGELRARLAELGDAGGEDAPEDLVALDAAIAELQELSREVAADRAAAAALPTHHADMERWDLRLHELTAEIESATAERRALAFSSDERKAAVFALEIARSAHQAAREAFARATANLDAATSRAERAAASLADYDARAERLTAAEAELRVQDAADLFLADFRSAMAAGIRPEIEELASAMVAQLTDGRFEAITLDEAFAPTAYRAGVPMEVISGGEEDVVALAMRLATSQLIAERAGHPLSLLVLDEPFGSQDQVRRANMLALIRRLSGVFEQVLVISHVDETREAVDRAITVRFDEASGRSFVEDAAPAPAWSDAVDASGPVLAEVG